MIKKKWKYTETNEGGGARGKQISLLLAVFHYLLLEKIEIAYCCGFLLNAKYALLLSSEILIMRIITDIGIITITTIATTQ